MDDKTPTHKKSGADEFLAALRRRRNSGGNMQAHIESRRNRGGDMEEHITERRERGGSWEASLRKRRAKLAHQENGVSDDEKNSEQNSGPRQVKKITKLLREIVLNRSEEEERELAAKRERRLKQERQKQMAGEFMHRQHVHDRSFLPRSPVR